jgi:hypothetical protein
MKEALSLQKLLCRMNQHQGILLAFHVITATTDLIPERNLSSIQNIDTAASNNTDKYHHH